jgi:uncharacterized protein (AIM24 family)
MATFELDGSRLLKVTIAGETFKALNGSMVAYDGDVNFKRQGVGGQGGVKGAFKRKLTGESLTLMDVSGKGVVYIANMAMEINLVQLAGEKIWVEASNLVALEAKLKTDQKFNGLRGATTGQGLFTTTVEGQGTVALLSDGPAIGLEVTPGTTLCVDPQAYVAHKGQLQQDFVTDVTWRTAVGQSSGESFQLRFSGQGTVYIQPAERDEGIDV